MRPDLSPPPSSGVYDRIWYASSGVTAIRGHYLIAVGSKRLARDQVQHQEDAVRILTARHSRFAYIGIREAGTDVRPAPDARTAMTELARRCAPAVTAAAIIYEGQGFAATIHRSLVTAIQIAAQIRFPVKVCDSLQTAAPWLEARVPPEVALGEELLLCTLKMVCNRAKETHEALGNFGAARGD